MHNVSICGDEACIDFHTTHRLQIKHLPTPGSFHDGVNPIFQFLQYCRWVDYSVVLSFNILVLPYIISTRLATRIYIYGLECPLFSIAKLWGLHRNFYIAILYLGFLTKKR